LPIGVEEKPWSACDVIRSNNLRTCRGTRVRLTPQFQCEKGQDIWLKAVADPKALIAMDLFCGAGGLSYGFQEAGFVSALGIDSDADACETHAANLLSRTLCLDIQTIKNPRAMMDEIGIPRVDVIIGGPPCQGFSLVGRGKVQSLSKEIQERLHTQNYLYREFVRFVESLEPLFFVMENVPHMRSFADGVIAQAIQQDFHALGYDIYPELLEATHYGVPQSRRRLFIIGTRIGWVYRKPRVTHGDTRSVRTLADAIADLPCVRTPCIDGEIVSMRCVLMVRAM
jgi:DNA (cytosine-5)-methyltransferase 1